MQLDQSYFAILTNRARFYHVAMAKIPFAFRDLNYTLRVN